MSGVSRNLITALMGKLGLGDGRAKSRRAPWAWLPQSFFRWGTKARSFDTSAKYNTAVAPSRSPAIGGGDERTPVPAPPMRVGVDGRHNSSGAAWHHGGE